MLRLPSTAAKVDRVPVTPQRVLLWERRNNNLPPFNETVQQVFARISALRDSLDGPQVLDALKPAKRARWTHVLTALGSWSDVCLMHT